MLAEKFFLFLETLISHASDDQATITISMAPQIPIELPLSKAPAVTPLANRKPRSRRAGLRDAPRRGQP